MALPPAFWLCPALGLAGERDAGLRLRVCVSGRTKVQQALYRKSSHQKEQAI
jgi:hypothetical protein